MSTFDNPFDAKSELTSGCSCGAHKSQAEHDHAAKEAELQAVTASEDKRFEQVVAGAVMRAMFPQDASRRAFLQSVGASTALAAISQFFPLATATEVFAQSNLLEKKDGRPG
jgi:nitrate/nitrite transport system substrate-binding protein